MMKNFVGNGKDFIDNGFYGVPKIETGMVTETPLDMRTDVPKPMDPIASVEVALAHPEFDTRGILTNGISCASTCATAGAIIESTVSVLEQPYTPPEQMKKITEMLLACASCTMRNGADCEVAAQLLVETALNQAAQPVRIHTRHKRPEPRKLSRGERFQNVVDAFGAAIT